MSEFSMTLDEMLQQAHAELTARPPDTWSIPDYQRANNINYKKAYVSVNRLLELGVVERAGYRLFRFKKPAG